MNKATRVPSRRVFLRRLLFDRLEERTLLSVSSANTGSLLVQLQPGDSPATVQGLATSDQAAVTSTSIPGLYQVSGSSADLAKLSASASTLPGVKYVQPDQTVHADLMPNDPLFTNGSMWGMSGAFGINAPTAWNVTTGSSSTVVADIDTGIDYNHPDLYLNIWINQKEIPADRMVNLVDVYHDGFISMRDLNSPINQGPYKIMDTNGDGIITGADLIAPEGPNGTGGWAHGSTQDGDTAHPDDLIGWNFVNNTNNPFDDHDHGTHTAGTIGAMGNNGVGVVGVNWSVQIMALKFLDSTGSGTELGAAEAIDYAANHGARVSNNSWGGGSGGTTVSDAISYANSMGDVFVAAAGNSGVNTDNTPNYPSAYNLPNIIAVAAMNSDGTLASFSNYGAQTVDLGAPGVGIYSTLPNNTYGSFSGTSMATPHVTGTVALLLTEHPTWTVSQIINQILSTTTPDSNLTGKTVTGGILNAGLAVQTASVDLNWTGGGISGPTTGDSQTPFTINRTYNISGGAAPNGFTISYFASTDTTFGSPNNFLIGTETISGAAALTAGTHTGVSPALLLPRAGTYHLFAQLDSGNALLETDKTNNVGLAPQTITLTGPTIIDDLTPGYAETGPGWTPWPFGYNGELRYVAGGTGGSTATWQVTGLAPGSYTVQTTWTTATNHATNAPYQIFDGSTLVQSTAVDQTQAPSGPTFGGEPFQTLATVQITTGTLKVVLTNNANGIVLADAVRVATAPAPTSNLPLIADDRTPAYTETGPGWTTWNGGYNNEQRYVAAGTGASTATWVVTGLASGTYTVQATWFANTDHATNAPYQFYDGSTLIQSVSVDQTQLPTGPVFGNQPFQTLATVTVTSGTLKVVLSNNANGYVLADAIRVDVAAPAAPITLPDIVDDGTTGYSQTGPGWTVWPAGYGGDLRYVAAGTGSSAATWQLTGLATGDYAVQTTWIPFSNHATNAPFQIFDGANLVQTVLVDQTQTPTGPTFGNEPFQTLATVHVTSGTLKVVVSNNANGYVLADAVRVSVGSAPSINLPLVDDDSTGPYTETGPGWTTWSSGYNGEQRYVAAGTGGSTASWVVAGLPSGSYTIQTTWFANTDHATNAPYQIFDGANLVQTVLVDQTQLPNGPVVGNQPFQTLATVNITSGTLRIVLSNNANGYVLADAIRVSVPAPAPPAQIPAIVDDGTAGYAQTGPGWTVWPAGYGGDLRYVAAGTGGSSASWVVTGLATGSYIVQTTWIPFSNHASNAPFLIYDVSTLLQTVLVDQQISPTGPTFGNEPFQTLATVNITSGTLKVVLTNNANGYVLADAIRVTTPAIGSVSSFSAGSSSPFGSTISTADVIDNGDLVSLVPVLADSSTSASSTDPAHRPRA